jgi:hypothetical protein
LLGSLTLAPTFLVFPRHARTPCRSNLSQVVADYNTWVNNQPKTAVLRGGLRSPNHGVHAV